MLTLTADPIPSAQRIFRATRIQISGYPKIRNNLINRIKIDIRLRISTDQFCVSNFLLLQYAGLWYLKYHTSQDYENKLDCFKLFISRPKGNRILRLTDFYDIR
jgi:hypothetical protein